MPNPTLNDLIDGNVRCVGMHTADKPILRKKFNCKRTVGVEWEYNNMPSRGSNAPLESLLAWTNKWGAGNHHDGSCGREVVTPPLAGDNIEACLVELGEIFKSHNASIDQRCAIHVHVDASDFYWDDMFKLIKVYALIEPVMYALGGHQRTSNRYCIPIGKSYELAIKQDDPKGAVLAVAYGSPDGRRTRKRSKGKKDGNRYRGLNIMPWLAGRGIRKNGNPSAPDTTVEFRIHKNSGDPIQVSGWAKLCARVVDWSQKASQSDIDALPKSPSRALTKIIAPDLSSWILDRLKIWRKESKDTTRHIDYDRGRYNIINASRTVSEDVARTQMQQL